MKKEIPSNLCFVYSSPTGQAQEAPSDQEDVTELVAAFIDSVPSFKAEWRVDEALSADPEFANYLDSIRSEQLTDYADKEDQEGLTEVDNTIKRQNEAIRQGLEFSHTLSLTYFGHENFVVDYLQDGWEHPVQYFSAGDGVVFEINHQNKEVRIKPYERYSLSSIVYGLPQILIAGLTGEKQRFSLEEIAGTSSSVVYSTPVQEDWKESAEALISVRVDTENLQTSQIVRFYRFQADGKEEYEDMPITRILFSDYALFPKSSVGIPRKVEVSRRYNVTSNKIDRSLWSLTRLQPSNEGIESCIYVFQPGYTVIDHRTDPHRVFKSDDVLSTPN